LAKRYDNLFPGLVRFTNLWQAYRQAARGKRGKPPVAAFELDLEANLLRLQAELSDRTYRPGGYYSFHIRDPKRRNGVAFARRLRGYRRQVARGEMDLATFRERLGGWIAHAAHGDTWGLRRALLREPLSVTRSVRQTP
jgi:hypothetical protein